MSAATTDIAHRQHWSPLFELLQRLWRGLLHLAERLAARSGAEGGSHRPVRHRFRPPWALREESGVRTLRTPDEHLFLGSLPATEVTRRLEDHGVLAAIRERGYDRLEVIVERSALGSRVRIFDQDPGQSEPLAELVAARRLVAGRQRLYVEWLLLQNPRARFARPGFPGQEAPGLGVGRDVMRLLGGLARELGLAGLAYRPSWYHVAHRMSRGFVFADPACQARFEALEQSLSHLPLAEASRLVAEGGARLGAEVYLWEPEVMIERATGSDHEAAPPAIRPLRESAAAASFTDLQAGAAAAR